MSRRQISFRPAHSAAPSRRPTPRGPCRHDGHVHSLEGLRGVQLAVPVFFLLDRDAEAAVELGAAFNVTGRDDRCGHRHLSQVSDQ